MSGSRHVQCSDSVGMGPDQQPVPGGDLLPAFLVHRRVCYCTVWLPDAELLLEIPTAGFYSVFFLLSHSVLVSGRDNEGFCIIVFVWKWLISLSDANSNTMIHQNFQRKLYVGEFELKKRKHDKNIVMYGVKLFVRFWKRLVILF